MKETKLNVSRHFLFNGLNCAVSLCRKSPDDTAELIVALSECMLYGSRTKSDDVDIHEEIEYIKSYLTVQQYRFEDRVSIVYEVDKNVHLKVPRYTLITIVENIFMHVMHYKKDCTKIKIEVNNPEQPCIIVCDNGGLMNPDSLKNAKKKNSLYELKSMLNSHYDLQLNIDVEEERTTCIMIHSI